MLFGEPASTGSPRPSATGVPTDGADRADRPRRDGTAVAGIVTGPPRPLVPDSLRADRGGGAPVRLPADAQARFDAARDRLRDARATRTADDLTVDDAPTPAAEIDAARARIDAARTRLSDRPRRRSAGRPPRT